MPALLVRLANTCSTDISLSDFEGADSFLVLREASMDVGAIVERLNPPHRSLVSFRYPSYFVQNVAMGFDSSMIQFWNLRVDVQ